ncbi:MAG: hypothetical protein IJM68_00870 [Synergistaceae bacterium]|nr:hypothetical protein [Synergistaceae bacterium]
MKDLELILEAVGNISNDKLVEAVSFSLRMGAIEDYTFCVGLIAIICFAIYSFSKSVINS